MQKIYFKIVKNIFKYISNVGYILAPNNFKRVLRICLVSGPNPEQYICVPWKSRNGTLCGKGNKKTNY